MCCLAILLTLQVVFRTLLVPTCHICNKRVCIVFGIIFEDRGRVGELIGQLRPQIKANYGAIAGAVYVHGIRFAHPKRG